MSNSRPHGPSPVGQAVATASHGPLHAFEDCRLLLFVSGLIELERRNRGSRPSCRSTGREPVSGL